MGFSRLQATLAQELDAVLSPVGFKRRGQAWQRGEANLRLRVRQAASIRDALVRFQLELDAAPESDAMTEPVWFLMLDEERRACVAHQRELLQHVLETAQDEEVVAIAGTLLADTVDEAWVEHWLVLASREDAEKWAQLLKPTLHRVLGA